MSLVHARAVASLMGRMGRREKVGDEYVFTDDSHKCESEVGIRGMLEEVGGNLLGLEHVHTWVLCEK